MNQARPRQMQVNQMSTRYMYPTFNDNPFHVTQREMITQEIRYNFLGIETRGLELYEDFQKERFVDKSKRLTDTIHRNHAKTFVSINSANKAISAF